MELQTVYVYPEGSNYDEPRPNMSDDYETRKTTLCEVCDEVLHLTWGEPIASCNCGDQEWYL